MILDSSAIVTIAFKEPDYRIMLSKLQEAENLAIGAPTLVETAIVLSARLQNDARGLLTRFLNEAEISTLPFGDAHYSTAIQAWRQYGKGRHPAAFNFGDCLSYAMAKLANQPLLCVENDFAKTDIELA